MSSFDSSPVVPIQQETPVIQDAWRGMVGKKLTAPASDVITPETVRLENSDVFGSWYHVYTVDTVLGRIEHGLLAGDHHKRSWEFVFSSGEVVSSGVINGWSWLGEAKEQIAAYLNEQMRPQPVQLAQARHGGPVPCDLTPHVPSAEETAAVLSQLSPYISRDKEISLNGQSVRGARPQQVQQQQAQAGHVVTKSLPKKPRPLYTHSITDNVNADGWPLDSGDSLWSATYQGSWIPVRADLVAQHHPWVNINWPESAQCNRELLAVGQVGVNDRVEGTVMRHFESEEEYIREVDYIYAWMRHGGRVIIHHVSSQNISGVVA